MDYILQIGNYSESSEINICLCPNYLDRFIMLYKYVFVNVMGNSVCISLYCIVLHQYFIQYPTSYFVNDVQV